VRYVWRGLAIGGLVLAFASAALAVYVARTWDRVWDVPLSEIRASSAPAIIQRGEYLVYGPAHCAVCHASSEAELVSAIEARRLAPLQGGQRFAAAPLGVVYSKNLTPDPETGIGRYSDAQIAGLLRWNVKPNGRSTVQALMPYQGMSDEDVTAIVSFLRAQPPVRHVVPVDDWTLIGKVVKRLAPSFKPRTNVHPPKSSPPSASTLARGEYLVRSLGNCGGCHTPLDALTFEPTGPEFSGGNDMAPAQLEGVDRTIWFKPPSLTLPKAPH